MHSHLLRRADGLRTFAVIMDEGEDAELSRFAAENDLTGVGACREATLAYFDPESRRYEDIRERRPPVDHPGLAHQISHAIRSGSNTDTKCA